MAPLPPGRVCFFAHYDSEGRIDRYVFRHVEALRAIGFTIVFCTTATIDEDARYELMTLCHDVIERENVGLDFGSWAEAFAKYRDQIDGDLLLANDSVYGPIGDLERALDQLVVDDADFYGMVESLEGAPHLQSWFIFFKPHVHQSDAFRRVLAQPFGRMSKNEIIRKAEIGLTQSLLAEGFRYRAAFLVPIGGWLETPSANPTHLLWREMLDSKRVPFVKVELLRDNPDHIADLNSWREVVAEHDPGAVAPMVEHMTRKRAVVLDEQAPDGMLRAFPSHRPFAVRDYRWRQEGRPLLRAANLMIFKTALFVRHRLGLLWRAFGSRR